MRPDDTIFTIGFTKKNAAQFFETLRAAGVKRVIDVRLNNSSQLAGFSKKDDLKYFLNKLLGVDYVEEPLMAPTQPLLDAFKKRGGRWEVYEDAFLELMKSRRLEEKIDPALVAGACLLCSEDKPHYCHRRLVAEYLRKSWGKLDICHLP